MLGHDTSQLSGFVAKREIRKHVLAPREGEIGIRRMIEAGIAGPEVLAYLWMAIESDLNVLVVGGKDSGKVPFLYSMFPFVPSYDKTLLFGCNPRAARYYNNFVSYVSDRPASVKRALNSAVSFDANRAVIAGLEGFHKEAFDCANRGIPILSTMDCGGGEPVDFLRKCRVHANTLCMLDVTVSIGRGDDAVWRVGGLSEYLWFSRSEYFMEEAVASHNFDFKKNNIVESAAFHGQSIGESKMVQAYSDLNVVEKRDAVAEFRRRSAFISRSLESSMPSREYVDSYFEIK
jgi:hypothetical protein